MRGRKRIRRLGPRPWGAQAKVKIRKRRKETVVRESRGAHGGCDERGRVGIIVKVVMVKVMCGEVRKSRLTVAGRLARDSGRA